MSWDDYVSKQLIGTNSVHKACIAGLDGNVWATSAGFTPSKQEVEILVKGFDNKDVLTSNGVYLGGLRHIYLSGDDKVIRAKAGKVGLHVRKTKTAVVIGIYEDPVQPQQAASVVENLGDYLEGCGY